MTHTRAQLLVQELVGRRNQCAFVLWDTTATCTLVIIRASKHLLCCHPSIFLLLLERFQSLAARVLPLLSGQVLEAVKHTSLWLIFFGSHDHGVRVSLWLSHSLGVIWSFAGSVCIHFIDSIRWLIFKSELLTKTVSFFHHEDLSIQITVFISAMA